MKAEEKSFFVKSCIKIREHHPDIHYFSITVRKCNVSHHIRNDPNKLYNYMVKVLLLHKMAAHPCINFIPDPRGIKVKSGNTLTNYLQTELWFTKNVKSKLIHHHIESSRCKPLQFVDMLSGIVQEHFEDNHTLRFNNLKKYIHIKKLYFKEEKFIPEKNLEMV